MEKYIIDINEARQMAEEELREEAIRAEVERHKEILRQKGKRKSLWDIIFPYNITITKKGLQDDSSK